MTQDTQRNHFVYNHLRKLSPVVVASWAVAIQISYRLQHHIFEHFEPIYAVKFCFAFPGFAVGTTCGSSVYTPGELWCGLGHLRHRQNPVQVGILTLLHLPTFDFQEDIGLFARRWCKRVFFRIFFPLLFSLHVCTSEPARILPSRDSSTHVWRNINSSRWTFFTYI